MPPNKLGPYELAKMFQEVQTSGLPGHYAVGRSKSCLGYSKVGIGKDNVAIIGKGITFDAGGISIKPAKNMHEMKFDMLGAATVLALAKPLSELNKTFHLYGCCAENTFHPNCTRPGDVIEFNDGTTVEIINTDAEGRLVLADGIIEAKKHNPKLIITIATLTGAAKAALGEGTALFSNNDCLAKGFLERSKEDIWRLPIWKQHRDNIKGQKQVSDLKNCGDIAGASTAAAFLEHFAGDTPWIHLDIAGSAYKDGVPTGAMYETLLNYFTGE